jgi:hypothetical protein
VGPPVVVGVGPIDPEGKTPYIRKILPEIKMGNHFILILVREKGVLTVNPGFDPGRAAALIQGMEERSGENHKEKGEKEWQKVKPGA